MLEICLEYDKITLNWWFSTKINKSQWPQVYNEFKEYEEENQAQDSQGHEIQNQI